MDVRDEAVVGGQQSGRWQWRAANGYDDFVLVEDEVIEHAFLDFMKLEFGLENFKVETGAVFDEDEEMSAHAELDRMLFFVQKESQEDMEVGDQDDPGGVLTDNCNRKAYKDGGTWWLDRWLIGRSDQVATHVSSGGCGKNMAMAVCCGSRQPNLLSARIVQPRLSNMGLVGQNHNMSCINNCSGYPKRTGQEGL